MISDSKLYSLLLKDSENGLEKLMDTYAGFVYTIVYSKLSGLGTPEDVEECVSDIFYEVYTNRFSIDLNKGSIKSYLSVIAKRRAIDYFRKLSKDSDKTASISIDNMDNGLSSESSALDLETKEALIKEIKALGEPDSEIIIRKYYFGQSTKLIAKVLKLKENTVDKKVSRGLKKLKESLGGVL